MASYKRFEDLPVWNAAIGLGVEIFGFTQHEAFRYRGDLVNQIRRAALSVSNNIAEGFERGSTAELISYLYIARGSCGETRSMLRFALKLGGMDGEREAIEGASGHCEEVSRQLYGWIDALKNSAIEGQRRLTDETRVEFVKDKLKEEFRAKFNPVAADAAAAAGDEAWSAYCSERLEALVRLREESGKALPNAGEGLRCPLCGGEMVKRHDRVGKAFWGCAKYPRCRGSRPYHG